LTLISKTLSCDHRHYFDTTRLINYSVSVAESDEKNYFHSNLI
jgi:hypothetical protein